MALARTTETAPEVAGPGGGAPAPTAPLGVRWTRHLGALRWLSLLVHNRKAAIGLGILAFFLALALVGPLIWSGDPNAADYSIPPMQPPSPAHPLGTDHLNHDIFLQLVDGAWPSLELGFAIGLCATALAVVIGMSAGYFGGWIDDVLSLVINIILIIPSLPLIIVLASWIRVRNDLPIILVISLTSWAAGARVLRSQTLSLRQKEFVQAAVVRGEAGLRIVLREILPNMTSLVVSNFIGTTVFAIGSAAGLVFLGLGNIAEVSWFSILYQAQNASALQDGAWWNFVPPGLAIALVGTALALVNYGIDEISNPRLRSERLKPPRRASVPTPAPAARKAAAR